jgi:hypothetical protein
MADLMALFEVAFREFLRRERDNIGADISERNLCGRLMLYLDAAREQSKLERYFVDIEYNRNKKIRSGSGTTLTMSPSPSPVTSSCTAAVDSRKTT